MTFTKLVREDRSTKFEDLNGVPTRFSATGFKITMRRKYLPFLIDYYLPSGLFVIVSWVSRDSRGWVINQSAFWD